MRYLSVCSGIEAATVAWHPLGWEPVGFAEIDPFPSAVLKHHYPNVPNFGDFTKIKREDLGDAGISLLVGGTPCQSFSVAGLRKGLDDPRGNLALAFLRLADIARPRWVVWENVPGVLSSTSHDAPDPSPPTPPLDLGRDGAEVETTDEYDAEELHAFSSFLAGLSELGYGCAYRVLDAQHFGVPQRRRRVFVVGYLGDWRRAAAVLFERHSLSGHPAPRREAGERVAGTLAPGAHPGGFNGRDAESGMLISGFRETGQGWWTEGQVSLRAEPGGMPENVVAYQATGAGIWREGRGPLATSDDNGTNQMIAHTLRSEGFDASEDGTGRGTPLVPVKVVGALCRDSFSGGAGGRPEGAAAGHFIPVAFPCKDHGADAGEVAPTLRSMGHDGSHANAGGQVAVAIQERALSDSDASGPGGKGWQEDVAYTMEARHRPRHVGYGMAVRRITPTEAERLQGFPDGYTDVPYRGKPAKDGPRYKALGNSMAVPCMRWIGERIQMVEALELNDLEAAA